MLKEAKRELSYNKELSSVNIAEVFNHDGRSMLFNLCDFYELDFNAHCIPLLEIMTAGYIVGKRNARATAGTATADTVTVKEVFNHDGKSMLFDILGAYDIDFTEFCEPILNIMAAGYTVGLRAEKERIEQKISKLLYPNIERARITREINKQSVAQALGISCRTYNKWLSSGGIPQSKLEALADLFNTSVSYLLS